MKFISNKSQESKRLVCNQLKNIGLDIDQSEIFTSLTAARQLVEQRGLRPYLIMEDTAREDFRGEKFLKGE